MRHSTALLTLLPVLALLPVSGTRAAESFDGCAGYIDAIPAVISTQGVWCLRQDLSTALASGTLILVAANNITIDCNDFKLGGLSAGTGTTATGIGALATRLNYTVRNCNIRGFQRGVAFNFPGSDGGVVEDNRFEGNTLVGISLTGEGNIVRRNRISDTGGSTSASTVYGIQLLNASGGRIEENTILGVFSSQAIGSPAGILVDGNANILRANFASSVVPSGSGQGRGIVILGDANVIDQNYMINHPPTAGIGVSSDVDSTCVNNRVRGFSTSTYGGCFDGGGNLE